MFETFMFISQYTTLKKSTQHRLFTNLNQPQSFALKLVQNFKMLKITLKIFCSIIPLCDTILNGRQCSSISMEYRMQLYLGMFQVLN